jgi:hypothetical protein
MSGRVTTNVILTFQRVRSLASTLLSTLFLRSSLIDFFKSAISLSIGIVTLNVVLSPSMRHQKVYVDILGGSEKLEKRGVVVERKKGEGVE